jgi:serine protease
MWSASSLAVGLLGCLTLSDLALSRSLPRSDDFRPRSGISLKLNGTSLRTARSGEDLVSSLMEKVQPSTGDQKRDVKYTIAPLITSVAPEKLAALVKRATELDPAYEPVDFSTWYQVSFEEEPSLSQLVGSLSEHTEVVSCQATTSEFHAPSVQFEDDPSFPEQGYIHSPSGGSPAAGIDAQYAWGFPGGDGAGTTLIDIEGGWKLDHEDLVGAGITLLSGENIRDRGAASYQHGTAVLGEMFMQDNTIGGVGIVPSAQGHVMGIFKTENGSRPFLRAAEAIVEAAEYLSPGDLILIEAITPAEDLSDLPIEMDDAVFDAIRLATALGITVIEPAGNGRGGVPNNLDQPQLRQFDTVPRSYLVKGSPEFRESGAIMVGAGSPTLPHTRLGFSNFGERVDVFSWGLEIFTTTTTTEFEDTYDTFSGTSGASPIIAGAALSIQGMVLANRGTKLTPGQLRDLIKIGGTPTSNPSVDKIGVQPNLRALIDGGHLN